jgi:hypothetical protein
MLVLPLFFFVFLLFPFLLFYRLAVASQVACFDTGTHGAPSQATSYLPPSNVTYLPTANKTTGKDFSRFSAFSQLPSVLLPSKNQKRPPPPGGAPAAGAVPGAVVSAAGPNTNGLLAPVPLSSAAHPNLIGYTPAAAAVVFHPGQPGASRSITPAPFVWLPSIEFVSGTS